MKSWFFFSFGFFCRPRRNGRAWVYQCGWNRRLEAPVHLRVASASTFFFFPSLLPETSWITRHFYRCMRPLRPSNRCMVMFLLGWPDLLPSPFCMSKQFLAAWRLAFSPTWTGILGAKEKEKRQTPYQQGHTRNVDCIFPIVSISPTGPIRQRVMRMTDLRRITPGLCGSCCTSDTTVLR